MFIPIDIKKIQGFIKGTEVSHQGIKTNPAVPTSWSNHSTVPRILATARSFGLNVYCLNETPGDGNCFYHAIIEQICDRIDLGEVSVELRLRYPNHHILRQSVVEFVRTQSELDQPPYYLNHYKMLFEGGVIDVPGAQGFTWNELLNQQARDTIYATEVFIKATAVLLQIDICVNSPSCDANSPFNRISCFWDRQLPFDANMNLSSYFLLASVNNNHFQSLLPCRQGLFANSDNATDIDFTIESRGIKKKRTCDIANESQKLKRKRLAEASSADHKKANNNTK